MNMPETQREEQIIKANSTGYRLNLIRQRNLSARNPIYTIGKASNNQK